MNVLPTPAPYQARRFTGLGTWAAADLQLKAYGITWRLDRSGPPLELQQAARDHAARKLPAAAIAEDHHGLGFVILHEGRQGTWLLMDWWAHGDITCQVMAHADQGSTVFTAINRPYLACVWETVVIAHERDAWVDTMLTKHPDPDAYLTRRLSDGNH